MAGVILRSSRAELRTARAQEWLSAHPPATQVLVVAATPDAASDLLRTAAVSKGASFGWYRATLGRLAAELAMPTLIENELAPIGRLASQAIVARVLHELAETDGLGRFVKTAHGPGLARAISETLGELRLAGITPESLGAVMPELRAIAESYEAGLQRAQLIDRAGVFLLAARVASEPEVANPLLGLPTLLLDVPVESAAERGLIEALAARSPSLLATVPAGDERGCRNLEAALGAEAEDLEHSADPTSLSRLQTHLFEESAPAPAPAELGGDVIVLSAPGESRECVEIARRLRRFAAEGIPFDRMAVLLRSPEEYRPHLGEALARAGIPAHFVRGAVRPDPAGRALLALLSCAVEGLSARRFAEYLSLGQVPSADEAGGPPAPRADRWVAPDEELVSRIVGEGVAEALVPVDPDGLVGDPEEAPVTAGTLRAPRRWEELLVDAAVIGGRDRWQRRLDGVEHELRLDLEALEEDDPRGERIGRDLKDLASLRDYALPLIDELDTLPARASWGEWLDALSALATRALRQPERVLSVLSELAPMAPVGPVALQEVRLVLQSRLQQVHEPASKRRYGQVYVAPTDAARGLTFDVVFVPGLAEKLFPRNIVEDPILLDAARGPLGGLTMDTERLAGERLALRLAVGAASRVVMLSYPRLDLDQARPRVPSFYMLEALRAAEGRLPGFDELAARAETLAEVRVGWPAPARPEDAIDEGEHDLALLEKLLRAEPGESVGTARYLLTANAHLGRALRFRARRWRRRWTVADGLVDPPDSARDAMREQLLSARSYSPTALQNFASCPYRFFLSAVLRLAPRTMPEAIEELNPLQRGSLVHEVQFELFRELSEQSLLPVTPQNLRRAREILDAALDRVAARTRDELAPAIERVWEDSVGSIRADLREWLLRMSEDGSGFVPWRYELAFGLPGRRAADPHSVPEAAELDCGIRLRGSIDLVERRGDGHLRATDHKTGKERFKAGAVVSGGEVLQPVLYALALEKVFPDAAVDSGRLYYCTSAGDFTERTVPLDEKARHSAGELAKIVGLALEKPFLPAAPARRACEWCDFQVVCGPYEELRTGRKPTAELADLEQLRGLS